MSDLPKVNRYGETLTQCTNRLRSEKVTPEIASRYAMDVARSFDNLHDDPNARFYREVASLLSAPDVENPEARA